jgi:hypothetical protein
MPISRQVEQFCQVCESLLSEIRTKAPLTEEEVGIVEDYCRELRKSMLQKRDGMRKGEGQ